jgi:hypothetical protein
MNREDFIANFPQTSKKWIAKGYTVDAKALIRAIIRAAAERGWPIEDERGPREVWYNPVKPIMLRAVGHRADKYSAAFEAELSKMVKRGELSYADIGIKDFRTLRETYKANDLAKCWNKVMLFVEKDSAYNHLRPLKELLNINIISGAGWSNTSGIEAQLNLMAQRGDTEIEVFTVTDYDAFGFAIDYEFVEKCKTMGFTVSHQQRIGINVEHATPELLNVQKYPLVRGRKLSVNGISFDSDKWLKEYGIDGTYGLEIEAISGQTGGHQHLREIVATELMKYLVEHDRVDEITRKAWESSPVDAIRLLFSFDHSPPNDESITTAPKELPETYMTYDEFDEQWDSITDEKNTATSDIDDEISDLEDQLEDARESREEIAKPYEDRLSELMSEYDKCRDVLAHSLYLRYKQREAEWKRDDYDLGYPKGCIVESIKQGHTLHDFLSRLNAEQIINDICDALQADLDNGAVNNTIISLLGKETI